MGVPRLFGICGARGKDDARPCRRHGGLATGPRTQAGRYRISLAQQKRWTAWRAAKAAERATTEPGATPRTGGEPRERGGRDYSAA